MCIDNCQSASVYLRLFLYIVVHMETVTDSKLNFNGPLDLWILEAVAAAGDNSNVF